MSAAGKACQQRFIVCDGNKMKWIIVCDGNKMMVSPSFFASYMYLM
jgi:hypothetical protein